MRATTAVRAPGAVIVAAAQRQAAVAIISDVDGIGILQFHQPEVVVAVGRRAARRTLPGGVLPEGR